MTSVTSGGLMLVEDDVVQDSSLEDDVIEDSSTLEDTQVQPSDSEDVKENVDDDDVIVPTDRPAKNVIAELERKLNKSEQDSNYARIQAEDDRKQLISKFDELASTMQKTQGNQNTGALDRNQLMTMIQRDPDNTAYYQAEINKMDTQEIIDKRMDVMKQESTKKEREREYTSLRKQSYTDVVQSYPKAIKDGRWDDSDPVVRRMSQILHTQKDPLSNQLLKDHPMGLTVAFNQAYREFSLTDSVKVTDELKHAKRNVKKLQKTTFTEGGGKAPASGGSNKKRLAQLRQAGIKSGDMTQYLIESGLAKHTMGEI